MTREQLESSAEKCYTKEEIQLLLRGFDIGMNHAREFMQDLLTQNGFLHITETNFNDLEL